MQIHFYRYFQLLKIMLLVLILLKIFSFLSFDLNLDLTLFSKIFLLLLLLFLILESLKNRILLKIYSENFLQYLQMLYTEKKENNRKAILQFLHSKIHNDSLVNVLTDLIVLFALVVLALNNFFIKTVILTSIFITVFLKSFSLDILPLNFEVRFVFLVFLWLIMIIVLKLKPVISLFNSTVLLCSSFYILIFNNDRVLAEKVSFWVFVFLTVGIIQYFLSFLFNPKEFNSDS